MAKFSGPGVAKVSEYCIYVIGEDGSAVTLRAFVCDNDADATIWAKQLIDRQDVELWSGNRFVTRVKSTAKRDAVSHEIDRRSVPKPVRSASITRREI
jgi:hypothetical protein